MLQTLQRQRKYIGAILSDEHTLNKKDINYMGKFTIPSNIYDGTLLWNYQLATLICELIN